MPWQLIDGAPSTTSVNTRSSSDTIITPSSWAGFPAMPMFALLVPRTGEIMVVTAVTPGTPNTWTVVRGVAAAALIVGDELRYVLTAETLIGGVNNHSLRLLTKTVLGANATTISASVPDGVEMGVLRIRGQIRFAPGGSGYLCMRVNGNTSAVYDTTYGYQPGNGNGRWMGETLWRMWSGTATIPYYVPFEMRILEPQSTTLHKYMLLSNIDPDSGGDYIMTMSGRWRPTTPVPITSVTLFNETTSWDMLAGSSLTLLGEP